MRVQERGCSGKVLAAVPEGTAGKVLPAASSSAAGRCLALVVGLRLFLGLASSSSSLPSLAWAPLDSSSSAAALEEGGRAGYC